MRVLLTNFNLSMRAGTQLYVRDLALGLLARGHQPLVYAPLLGTVASELETAGIAVVDDLDEVQTPPDIIHGNQFFEIKFHNDLPPEVRPTAPKMQTRGSSTRAVSSFPSLHC